MSNPISGKGMLSEVLVFMDNEAMDDEETMSDKAIFREAKGFKDNVL